MALIYITIWGFMLVAGASSVAALVWGAQHGQLRGSAQDAASIFELDDTVTPRTAAKQTGLSTRGE
jgi:hypothetical protein